MATPIGKTPLQATIAFRAKNWFTTAFKDFASQVASDYASRNEITAGGVVTDGTAAVTTFLVTTTAMECVLNGQIMATLAVISNDDLLEVGGATTGVGAAIFSDGALFSGDAITVAADETAFATLIVTNSNDAGGVAATDGGAPLFVVVFAGTGTTYNTPTAHLTSYEIQAALDASVNHTGATGWAHVGQIAWTRPGGTVAQATTMNRNNVTSSA